MIKVYELPITRINEIDTPHGIKFIHHATVVYGYGKAIVVQDTTPEEDSELVKVALKVRQPSKLEMTQFQEDRQV